MKRITYLLFLVSFSSLAQDNCNVFLWEGDTCRYEACTYIQEQPGWYQLTREFHEIFDKAIEICPDYAQSYRSKSDSYLKTGDFINWKKNIDKAVELDPKQHLGYRGWCRFQFFRDYEGALADFIVLDTLLPHDIGYSSNGAYHLNIARAVCLKKLGNKDLAIQYIEKQIAAKGYNIGFFDYLHLGVLYLEKGRFSDALATFEKQNTNATWAETEYYKAQAFLKTGKLEEAEVALQKARTIYEEGQFMFDNYSHQVDKIYLAEINEAISSLSEDGEK